jgi:hypothetical protein
MSIALLKMANYKWRGIIKKENHIFKNNFPYFLFLIAFFISKNNFPNNILNFFPYFLVLITFLILKKNFLKFFIQCNPLSDAPYQNRGMVLNG